MLALAACATTKPSPLAPAAAEPAATPKAEHSECNGEMCLAKNSVPLFFPSYTTPCPNEGSVKGIMAKHMSPALSRVTEALYHSNADEAERMQAVSDAAALMLGCAPAIAGHGHTLENDSPPTFDHFLQQLVVDVNALQNAAMEDELSEVQHWYHHVKQACASCHSRFWKR